MSAYISVLQSANHEAAPQGKKIMLKHRAGRLSVLLRSVNLTFQGLSSYQSLYVLYVVLTLACDTQIFALYFPLLFDPEGYS